MATFAVSGSNSYPIAKFEIPVAAPYPTAEFEIPIAAPYPIARRCLHTTCASKNILVEYIQAMFLLSHIP